MLVAGGHAGPGLWKVSKRAHSLFILGTHVPLPEDLVWRSQEVESAIARSNELLATLEHAINRNEATFAALPMHLLQGKEGVIARLRASGYAIEEPELLSR